MKKLLKSSVLLLAGVCAASASEGKPFEVKDYPIEDGVPYKIPVAFGVTTTLAIHARVIATPGKAFDLHTADDQSPQKDVRPAFEGSRSEINGTTFISFTPVRADATQVETNLNIFLADGRSFVVVPVFSQTQAGIIRFGRTQANLDGREKPAAVEIKPFAKSLRPESRANKSDTESTGNFTAGDKAQVIGIAVEKPPAKEHAPDESTVVSFFRILQMLDAYPATKIAGVSRIDAAKKVFATTEAEVTQTALVSHLNKDIFGAIGMVENLTDEPMTLLPADVAVRIGTESLNATAYDPEIIPPKSRLPVYAVFYRNDAHLIDFAKTPTSLTILPRKRQKLDAAGRPQADSGTKATQPVEQK